ncbi:MAG: DUF4349 domain-containing protein, partial [Thermomicrobium sp.]|nr:DUF4349 domain-containing protein [Thermomicrobium sp.]
MRRALRFGTDGWNATSDQDEPRWEEDPYGVASEEPARNDAPSPALSYRLLSVPEPRADRAQRGDLDRAVVSRAVLRLAVTDVSAAAAHAQEVASVHGGYTIEARIERRADATSARVVIAVPATAFRGVLDELRRLSGLRAIESESVSGQDVTSELTDIEARLRASRATEERFLTLLQRAESVQD